MERLIELLTADGWIGLCFVALGIILIKFREEFVDTAADQHSKLWPNLYNKRIKKRSERFTIGFGIVLIILGLLFFMKIFRFGQTIGESISK